MIELFNGALTLNRQLMLGLREAPDTIQRGFLLILFVGVLVGGVNGISNLLSTATPEQTLQNFRRELETQIDQLVLTSNDPSMAEVTRVINENKEPFFALINDIQLLPTPLPRPVGQLFQLLATTISSPLSYLSSMLLAAVAAHIVARRLNGEGSLQQMIGLSSLSVAPHALDALAFIPGLGGTITLIAWAWGLVVLIVATSIAHRIDSSRATMAVLFIPLLMVVLIGLACCLLLVFAGVLAGANPA